jgi:hypothetical protein
VSEAPRGVHAACRLLVTFWDRHVGDLVGGRLAVSNHLSSHLDILVSEQRSVDEGEVGVVGQLLGQPQEGLFEVIVGLGGDVVVLEGLLAVEDDHLSPDLAVDAIDFVTAENDGDLIADTHDVAIPVGNVLVGVSASNVEHDDGAVALDVVTIAESTELLLTGGIPAVEADLSTVGVEDQRVDIDTDSGDVTLLELTGQVALDEGGLSCTTVADEDQLEEGDAVSQAGLLSGSGSVSLLHSESS